MHIYKIENHRGGWAWTNWHVNRRIKLSNKRNDSVGHAETRKYWRIISHRKVL